MALEVKHDFECLIADDPASAIAGEILPSHWNEPLLVTLTGAALIGKPDAGDGDAVEIPLGLGLEFATGELAVDIPALGFGTMANETAADYYTSAQTDTEISDAIAAHEAAANPHPTYLTAAEGNAAYDALGASAAVAATIPEVARDTLGTALTAGAGIAITPNDGGDTITLALSRGPARIAGNWYFPESYTGTLAAGIALASGIIYYCPFVLDRAITVSDLGARITTLAASGNVKLAIYANNGSTNRPTGTPIAETASISTASAVNVSADITGSNVALAADTLYWAAFWADATAAGTVILQANTAASVSGFSRFVGGAQDEISSGATGGVSYVQSSEAYGTWPDAASESLTVTSNANRYYALQLKAA